MPNIVALAGRRKSGKTLAAKLIVQLGEDMGVEIKRRSFTHLLKQYYSRHYGVALEDLYDEYQKEQHREKLIKFASRIKTKYPELFIREMFKGIEEDDNIVIDDLRTMEELQAVLKFGGKPVKIHADRQKRFIRGAWPNPEIDNDISETELGDLSGYTFHALGGDVIYNNFNGEEDLKKELVWITRTWFGRS